MKFLKSRGGYFYKVYKNGKKKEFLKMNIINSNNLKIW